MGKSEKDFQMLQMKTGQIFGPFLFQSKLPCRLLISSWRTVLMIL